MAPRNRLDRYLQSAPFKRFGSIQRLGPDRSGHASVEHVGHQLGRVLYTLCGRRIDLGRRDIRNYRSRGGDRAELRTILLTALQQDADGRYQSIEEMSAALAVYLESIWPDGSDHHESTNFNRASFFNPFVSGLRL